MRSTSISAHDPAELRRRIADSRLMLIFSPELCGPGDPCETLESVLEWVDVIQIRPKPTNRSDASGAPSSARDVHDWCLRVLDVLAAHPALLRPVIVNDRVDVAAVLWAKGCAGVHVGQDDCPVANARALLGPDPLIGLSTHDMTQVGAAMEERVDYLGFGPIHATRTKGYLHGLGPDVCSVASQASTVPVFPIGGIDAINIGELTRVGRAAVGSAILSARDPARAACELRTLLSA
jgi:thiamine-phosphate pyrophosphorylase